MPKILLDLSENMLNHIKGFKEHYGFPSRTEAMRQLFLKAFEAYGNPLTNEPPSTLVGTVARQASREAHAEIAAQSNERYEELIKQLGLTFNE